MAHIHQVDKQKKLAYQRKILYSRNRLPAKNTTCIKRLEIWRKTNPAKSLSRLEKNKISPSTDVIAPTTADFSRSFWLHFESGPLLSWSFPAAFMSYHESKFSIKCPNYQ